MRQLDVVLKPVWIEIDLDVMDRCQGTYIYNFASTVDRLIPFRLIFLKSTWITMYVL